MASKSGTTKSAGGFFPKGGSTKMFSKQSAGSQKPGTSAHEVSGGGDKFPKGGKTKMFGKQHADPRKSGQSGK